MGLTCSDPYKEGCTRPTPTGIFLKGAPGNPGKAQPCQKCRMRLARDDRKRRGLPDWRVGAGQAQRL